MIDSPSSKESDPSYHVPSTEAKDRMIHSTPRQNNPLAINTFTARDSTPSLPRNLDVSLAATHDDQPWNGREDIELIARRTVATFCV